MKWIQHDNGYAKTNYFPGSHQMGSSAMKENKRWSPSGFARYYLFLATLFFASVLVTLYLTHYHIPSAFIRGSTSPKPTLWNISAFLVKDRFINETSKGTTYDSISLSSKSINYKEQTADFIRRWCDYSEGNHRPILYMRPGPGRLGKSFR